ncbi:MAG: RNA polymerase-binding protein RbpA [Actinobacteria bacterium]|nr:RNA polymerase-binding protein RbpA [Actinomycetota bacterium]
MADRSLRGMSIGSKSMESEENVEFAPRQLARYDCPNGHVIELPFSLEAEVPAVWECRCGEEAILRDHVKPEPTKPVKQPRTHWDMLLERRTREELEVLLEERLELLRSGQLRSRRTA